MTTLNQIRDLFEALASNHQIINGFGFGADYDIVLSTDTLYPHMYVEVQPASFEERVVLIPFNIVFSDRVDKGINNETDVLSDMLNVALDVRAMLYDSSNFPYFSVVETGTLTPFRDATDDEVAGWIMEIVTGKRVKNSIRS